MKKTNLLFAILIVLLAINSNAQIIYTDITDGVPVGIDFNSDGTMEFDLTTGTNPGDYIDYTSYGADNNIHAIGTMATSDWDVPDCVSAGFTVDASNQWEGGGDCSVDAWGAGNNTVTFNQDEYLGIRFNLGGSDIYYGWVRFSMDNSGVMTYKDYAYNSTPNSPINTGAMGSTTVLVASITVQGAGGASTITTQNGTLQMTRNVLPANATDNSVTWSIVNGTGSATINTNGLLTATGDGTVTATATANDGSAISGTTIITISNQTVGIYNFVSNNNIILYPNPIKNSLRIDVKDNSNISKIEIVNLLGEKVYISKTNYYTVNTSEFKKGVYFVNIYDNEKIVYSQKIIKL